MRSMANHTVVPSLRLVGVRSVTRVRPILYAATYSYAWAVSAFFSRQQN